MKQKICKSELIPKYESPVRTALVSWVTTLPGYQEGIQKGLPLFTKEELDKIKENYSNKKNEKENGLTWEDINRLLQSKGIIFKKATFRKYIQEGLISKAIGYRPTEKGRAAVFPADTISHINFVQYYYKVMDGEHADNIINIIKDQQTTYLEAVKANLSWCDNVYAAILHYICFDDGDVESAIHKALENRPGDRDKFLKILDGIDDKFKKTIGKDIDQFVSLLEKKSLSVFETITDDQEGKNEKI